MLPILIILLLIQSLSATNEFPTLMQNIQVSWNGVDLTSKIDARLTSSLDNQVRYFYLCGPYQTAGKDGKCKMESYYQIPNGQYYATSNQGFSSTDAQLIATYDENTFTCMRYNNPIENFMVSKQYKWYVHYNCETVSASASASSRWMILYAIGAIIVLATIGFFAFTIGKKKGAESSQGSYSGAYGVAYGGNNTNVMHGGNPSYGIPAYGNPFA